MYAIAHFSSNRRVFWLVFFSCLPLFYLALSFAFLRWFTLVGCHFIFPASVRSFCHFHFHLKIPVVITCTTFPNTRNSTFSQHSEFVFCLILSTNSDCFLNGLAFVMDTVCLLWGGDWVFVPLDELYAVSLRSHTVENRVRSRAIPREKCGRHSSTGTVVLPVLGQYHPPILHLVLLFSEGPAGEAWGRSNNTTLSDVGRALGRNRCHYVFRPSGFCCSEFAVWTLGPVCLSNLKSLFLPHREHNVPHDKDESDCAVSGKDRRLFRELHEVQWMRCVEKNSGVNLNVTVYGACSYCHGFGGACSYCHGIGGACSYCHGF